MKTPSIEILRKQGFKVRVSHLPKIGIVDAPALLTKTRHTTQVIPYGETIIDITSPEGVNVSGRAKLANGDQPNRKLGNTIALGRAWKALQKLNASNAGFTLVEVLVAISLLGTIAVAVAFGFTIYHFIAKYW